MIVHESGINNPWHRAAVSWFVSTLLMMLMAYAMLDESDVQAFSVSVSTTIVLGVTTLLYAIGVKSAQTWKLTTYATVLGIFAYTPILLALVAPLYLLFLIHPFTVLEMGVIVGGTISAALLIAWHELGKLRWSLANSHFVDKTFVERADHFFVRRDPVMELPEKPGFLSGRAGSRLLSLSSNLVYLLPLAYIAQRMASDTAGAAGVLTLMSVLSIPLAIHILSQLARGYYLWIHTVRGIERRTGKPVVLMAS